VRHLKSLFQEMLADWMGHTGIAPAPTPQPEQPTPQPEQPTNSSNQGNQGNQGNQRNQQIP
jgi:hypothetical protein